MTMHIAVNSNSWNGEEWEIASRAVEKHRRDAAAERYRLARLEYHRQIEPGDSIDFRDPDHGGLTSGVVTHRGSEAGWADANGVSTHFGYRDVVTVWRDGEAL